MPGWFDYLRRMLGWLARAPGSAPPALTPKRICLIAAYEPPAALMASWGEPAAIAASQESPATLIADAEECCCD